MEWYEVFEIVEKHVVRIETPTGQGTGFFCLFNVDKTTVGIATACHVVKHAEVWQEPIRIVQGQRQLLVKESDRTILSDASKDSAVVLINAVGSELVFPNAVIDLIPPKSTLKIGTEIGWLGFPAVPTPEVGTHCCFFAGKTSCVFHDSAVYFIDGVTINGVSGGPVVYRTGEDIRIVGSISAYIANRATGEPLPGLSVAQQVTLLHEAKEMIR